MPSINLFIIYSTLPFGIISERIDFDTYSISNTTNFENLTTHRLLFVDKTLLLQALFDNSAEDGRTIAITTPRGFGKTTNLDMIRCFANIETDWRGCRVDRFATSRYRDIFSPKAQLGLRIAQHMRTIEAHFASYPVVYVDLANVTAPSLRQTVRNLHVRVKQSYQRYQWLESAKQRMIQRTHNTAQRNYHRKDWQYINKLLTKQPNAADVHTGLSNLIRMLVEIFQQKAVLLIDNYDAPVTDAVYHRSNTTIDQYYEFLRVFYSTTLDDTVNNTKLVVLTGRHPVSVKTKTDIEFYSFLSQHDLGQYFGYTETDVRNLLARNTDPTMPVQQQLRNSFGGYSVNGSTTLLYNAASINEYFQSMGTGNYSQVAIRTRFFDPHMRKLVKKFMPDVTCEEGKGIEACWRGRSFEITPCIELDQLERISNIINRNDSIINDHDMDTYFRILFANGYFSHPNDSPSDVISFPNLQMRNTFRQYLQ